MNNPTIYLAGKIGKNDWRHDLVPSLKGHLWENGSIKTPSFNYSGPFFVSCDHGCYHHPNAHGAGASTNSLCNDDLPFTKLEVIANNNLAIEASDLVFVYITDTSCYGTLVEIGCALKDDKRLVMTFAPNVPHNDFWFSHMQADAAYFDVDVCFLKRIFSDEIEKTKAWLEAQKGVL